MGRIFVNLARNGETLHERARIRPIFTNLRSDRAVLRGSAEGGFDTIKEPRPGEHKRWTVGQGFVPGAGGFLAHS